MKIHALTTGTVSLKHAFLYASTGWRRQIDLVLPGKWHPPAPIHCWAIEHDGRLLLVDTGETANVNDVPFARFQVRPEDELPGAFAAAGLDLGDVDTAVLTHMHGDHIDGAVHLNIPVLVHDEDLAFTKHNAGTRDAAAAAPADPDAARLHAVRPSTAARSARSPGASRSATTAGSSPSTPPVTRSGTSRSSASTTPAAT